MTERHRIKKTSVGRKGSKGVNRGSMNVMAAVKDVIVFTAVSNYSWLLRYNLKVVSQPVDSG